MDAKIREILDQIVREIVSSNDLDTVEQNLTDRLWKLGYQFSEIRQAFDLLFTILEDQDGEREESGAVRIMSDLERLYLTNDSRHYLFSMYHHDLITRSELNEVLTFITVKARVFDKSELERIMPLVLKLDPALEECS